MRENFDNIINNNDILRQQNYLSNCQNISLVCIEKQLSNNIARDRARIE